MGGGHREPRPVASEAPILLPLAGEKNFIQPLFLQRFRVFPREAPGMGGARGSSGTDTNRKGPGEGRMAGTMATVSRTGVHVGAVVGGRETGQPEPLLAPLICYNFKAHCQASGPQS